MGVVADVKLEGSPKILGQGGSPASVCVCVSVFGDLQGNTLTQFMYTHKHRHTQYHPPTSLCYLLLSLTELSVCLKQSPHSQATASWSEPMTELRWGIMGNEVSGAAYLCANAVTKGYRCVFLCWGISFRSYICHMKKELSFGTYTGREDSGPQFSLWRGTFGSNSVSHLSSSWKSQKKQVNFCYIWTMCCLLLKVGKLMDVK